MTPYSTVIDAFLKKTTDDMYLEITREETEEMAADFIPPALPYFEFPRVNIYNYDTENQQFNVSLNNDEIQIIATYMVVCWLDQQLASVELTRMKYSGSDFKFTSQANHLSKLVALKENFIKNGFHLQRVYKRRKSNSEGIMISTMTDLCFSREDL